MAQKFEYETSPHSMYLNLCAEIYQKLTMTLNILYTYLHTINYLKSLEYAG